MQRSRRARGRLCRPRCDHRCCQQRPRHWTRRRCHHGLQDRVGCHHPNAPARYVRYACSPDRLQASACGSRKPAGGIVAQRVVGVAARSTDSVALAVTIPCDKGRRAVGLGIAIGAPGANERKTRGGKRTRTRRESAILDARRVVRATQDIREGHGGQMWCGLMATVFSVPMLGRLSSWAGVFGVRRNQRGWKRSCGVVQPRKLTWRDLSGDRQEELGNHAAAREVRGLVRLQGG